MCSMCRMAVCILRQRASKSTVIVAAITSQTPSKAALPTHCYLGAESGLERPSIILLEQLRTIDNRRLGRYIGRLSKERIEEMDRALLVSLDLHCQVSEAIIMSLRSVCAGNFRNTGAYYLCRLDPGQIKKEVCSYFNCFRLTGRADCTIEDCFAYMPNRLNTEKAYYEYYYDEIIILEELCGVHYKAAI